MKLSGIDLFDLPPKLKREYKFQIYSYKQLPEVIVLLGVFGSIRRLIISSL